MLLVFISILLGVLNVLDEHERFKFFSIIMDNTSIYTREDISKYVMSRGYSCIRLSLSLSLSLSLYPPEINLIEQFWSIVKSKIKRARLLEKETFSSRISRANSNALYSALQGFYCYSDLEWQVCLNKPPLHVWHTLCQIFVMLIKKN